MSPMTPEFDSERDLQLQREIGARPETLWRCWTEPDLLKQWFCPRPWAVTEAEIDLRPGGIFRTLMQGPGGEQHDNPGCFLEVVPNRRLVFTDALGPGWRPAASSFMTAIVTFVPIEGGTRYHAHCLHASAEQRKTHEDMGFEPGWGTAAAQLADLARAVEAAGERQVPV